MIRLTKRLEAIKNRIKPGGNVVDVGTDHGMLPVYLIKNGISAHVTATDINREPLNNAIRLAHDERAEVEFILTDGLAGLSPTADTVVIAGMGGETMIGIMEAAPWLRERDVQLILQPQSKEKELTVWLSAKGYEITDGELVREREKWYTVIEVRAGNLPMDELFILRLLRRKGDPLISDYLDYLIKRQRYIVGGLEMSSDSSQLALERARLEEMERIKNGES